MKRRSERLARKEARAGLRCRMAAMIDEANALRSEAAKKVEGVPKGYKLNTWRDDIRLHLVLVAELTVALSWIGLFMWSLENEHKLITVLLAIILGISTVLANAARNRPYEIEAHMQDYYVNDVWYSKLSCELARLKDGIADYDRQYEEQKECIQKFKEKRIEVGNFGSLTLVLKAGDFHARVKMATATDEVDCRLEFNEEGYKQLLSMLQLFKKST